MTSHGLLTHHGLLAQQPCGQWIVIAFLVVLLLTRLAFVMSIGRLVGPWLQSRFAGAPVPLAELLAMRLRNVPSQDVVRLRIMAVHAGVPLTAAQLESAWLQGANVERAVLAMIRAHETGQKVTWDDLLSTDAALRVVENANH